MGSGWKCFQVAWIPAGQSKIVDIWVWDIPKKIVEEPLTKWTNPVVVVFIWDKRDTLIIYINCRSGSPTINMWWQLLKAFLCMYCWLVFKVRWCIEFCYVNLAQRNWWPVLITLLVFLHSEKPGAVKMSLKLAVYLNGHSNKLQEVEDLAVIPVLCKCLPLYPQWINCRKWWSCQLYCSPWYCPYCTDKLQEVEELRFGRFSQRKNCALRNTFCRGWQLFWSTHLA